jgi:uncharacterized membrane protein YfhO
MGHTILHRKQKYKQWATKYYTENKNINNGPQDTTQKTKNINNGPQNNKQKTRKLTMRHKIQGSWSIGSTKDYEIGICCFSAKHAALKRKSKDWLAQNQDNVSECGDI